MILSTSCVNYTAYNLAYRKSQLGFGNLYTCTLASKLWDIDYLIKDIISNMIIFKSVHTINYSGKLYSENDFL